MTNYALSLFGQNCTWYQLNCDPKLSASIIQASRVDQALCDEAEDGRAHGACIVDGGYLWCAEGCIRISLHQGDLLNSGKQVFRFPFDRYTGGEPLIERVVHFPFGACQLNGTTDWNTQFPYLRISVFPTLTGVTCDICGLSDVECQQISALGGKWGLSANWGGANRLSGKSNWHYDDSILTTWADSSSVARVVYDSADVPQYVVELIQIPGGGYLLLPVRFLKRDGFWGPRRVFFPPEQDIAIWYPPQPSGRPQNVILTYDPGALLLSQPSQSVIGCLPGGPDSVEKSDFSSLIGRLCWIPIVDPANFRDVEFAVKLVARLRREHKAYHIVKFQGATQGVSTIVSNLHGMNATTLIDFEPKEIDLAELSQLAREHGIRVPEELRNDYFGDLTENLARCDQLSPIINGVLDQGEVTLITERDLPWYLLLTHIAKQLCNGSDIFPGKWQNVQDYHPVVFVDEMQGKVANRYHLADYAKVCDCRWLEQSPEERLKQTKFHIGEAQVVFVAAATLLERSEVFLDFLRACKTKRAAVMIFATQELSPRILRVISYRFAAAKIDGNDTTIAITGDSGVADIRVQFDQAGVLQETEALSADAKELVEPVQTVPSTPYMGGGLFMKDEKLPPEKKLALLMKQINLQKNAL